MYTSLLVFYKYYVIKIKKWLESSNVVLLRIDNTVVTTNCDYKPACLHTELTRDAMLLLLLSWGHSSSVLTFFFFTPKRL